MRGVEGSDLLGKASVGIPRALGIVLAVNEFKQAVHVPEGSPRSSTPPCGGGTVASKRALSSLLNGNGLPLRSFAPAWRVNLLSIPLYPKFCFWTLRKWALVITLLMYFMYRRVVSEL